MGKNLITSNSSCVDVDRILCISLAKFPRDDGLTWRGEVSNDFSVRNAYKILLQESNASIANYNQSEFTQLYEELWLLDLPQKVKITNWRFIHNFFLTFYNVQYRRQQPVQDARMKLKPHTCV